MNLIIWLEPDSTILTGTLEIEKVRIKNLTGIRKGNRNVDSNFKRILIPGEKDIWFIKINGYSLKQKLKLNWKDFSFKKLTTLAYVYVNKL